MTITTPSTRSTEQQLRTDAQRWVRRLRIFYTIAGIYAALSVMWLLIDLADDSSGFWFYWPMLGCGIGVAIAGMFLVGVGGAFGTDWEERHVERYVERRRSDDVV
jgi:two-component system, LytTR family, sensor kinase